MSGSSYTDVFGGTVVKPSQPSYLALTITADTSLRWPLETTQGSPVVAAEIDVTASSGGLSLTMPSGDTGSTGVVTMIVNVGSNTFTVRDSGGNSIAVIATTQAWIISLTNNSTANGTWRATQLGATVSQATASDLAGAGLIAGGSKLLVTWIPLSLSTNTTLTSAHRANIISWTSGTGTLQLAHAVNLQSGWYCGLTNVGTQTVTVTCSGGELINGDATLSVPVGDSGIIICTGTAFVSVGALISPLGVKSGGTGATTANAALTNLGGTSIGISIFTALNAAAVTALLGATAATFTESSVAINQALSSGSTNTAFVCTAGLSITLPDNTTLSTLFSFTVFAQGGAVTVTPAATDKINDGSVGVAYVVPEGASALFVTDAATNWWPIFASLPLTGGTLTGALTVASGGIDVTGTSSITGTLSASNGTTGNNVVNFSQFTQTAAVTGKVTVPDGFIFQWDTTVSDGAGIATATFGTAYSAGCFFACAIVEVGGATSLIVTLAGSPSTTTAVFHTSDATTGASAAGVNIRWLAIGK